MIISIASGKGGTGKTTLSTSLAVSIPGNVQFLDCDVEEPNGHLFLTPEIKKREQMDARVPKIDLNQCTLCRKCMEICRFGAIAVLKDTVMVFEDHCHSCGGCLAVCPEGAVHEVSRPIGEVESGQIGQIAFAHGKLDIGQVMAPPVIRQVRSCTDDNSTTIIDAPPGTSCPVITAVNKTDFVILVTEPTPFGLHDLRLAVETVRLLGIPHGIVINRDGVGNDDVRHYAQKENIPILMEIPFSKEIAKIYSNGGIVALQMPEIKEKCLTLFHTITTLVNNPTRINRGRVQ